MAFSVSQIKVKKYKNNDVRQYFSVINSIPIMTDNIKYALNRYINYSVKLRRTSDFYNVTLLNMVQELFEKCCDKTYNELCINDLLRNENEILYQIKKAIYYGATKHIYNIYDEGIKDIKLLNLRKDILPPKRISSEQKLNQQQVSDYFKELVI